MIKLFLVLNNLGKPRIEKIFISLPSKLYPLFDFYIKGEEKNKVVKKLFAIALTLEEYSCNFFKDEIFPNCKIVIRKYGSLFFILVIDESESELGILDLIQIIVEALNNIFPNASESDLMLNPDKANQLIDEIIIGGEVIETNLQEIMLTVQASNLAEK